MLLCHAKITVPFFYFPVTFVFLAAINVMISELTSHYSHHTFFAICLLATLFT